MPLADLTHIVNLFLTDCKSTKGQHIHLRKHTDTNHI